MNAARSHHIRPRLSVMSPVLAALAVWAGGCCPCPDSGTASARVALRDVSRNQQFAWGRPTSPGSGRAQVSKYKVDRDQLTIWPVGLEVRLEGERAPLVATRVLTASAPVFVKNDQRMLHVQIHGTVSGESDDRTSALKFVVVAGAGGGVPAEQTPTTLPRSEAEKQGGGNKAASGGPSDDDPAAPQLATAVLYSYAEPELAPEPAPAPEPAQELAPVAPAVPPPDPAPVDASPRPSPADTSSVPAPPAPTRAPATVAPANPAAQPTDPATTTGTVVPRAAQGPGAPGTGAARTDPAPAKQTAASKKATERTFDDVFDVEFDAVLPPGQEGLRRCPITVYIQGSRQAYGDRTRIRVEWIKISRAKER